MIPSFRQITKQSLDLLVQWLSKPHVQKWWREPVVLESVTEKYGGSIKVLEEALQTGAVGNYEQWLHANYLPACAAALFLSRGYYEWANDLTWNDPTITIEKFHEVDNTMEDSGGEALPLHSNNEAPPILVNLELGEVYKLATYQADANQIVAA